MQLLLPVSLRVWVVVTPLANFPEVVTFFTPTAPGCRQHGRASTGNGARAVEVDAGQVVDGDIVRRPTDPLPVEFAFVVASVFDAILLGRERLNDDVLEPVVRDYITHLF